MEKPQKATQPELSGVLDTSTRRARRLEAFFKNGGSSRLLSSIRESEHPVIMWSGGGLSRGGTCSSWPFSRLRESGCIHQERNLNATLDW